MKKLLCLTLILCGCASTELSSGESYSSVIDTYTDHAERYSGIYNLLNVRATILNSVVKMAQVEKRSHSLQWMETKTQEEKEQVRQNMSQKTEVFFSFFSPDRKNDDLDKTASIWRIFLDVPGKRYVGTVSKAEGPFSNLVELYPYLDRFSSYYVVSFTVPTAEIERQEGKLVMTSSVSSAELNFNAMK